MLIGFTGEELLKEEQDEHFKNFVLGELNGPEAIESKKRGLESQSMGLRFPIWIAACNHEEFSYQLACAGAKDRETAFLRFASLSEPTSWDRQRHPELQMLSSSLVKFLQERYHDVLNIPVSTQSLQLQ